MVLNQFLDSPRIFVLTHVFPVRFALRAKNRYTTKKGQEVGYGGCGISDEGIIKYKALKARLKGESREERRGIKNAWIEYAEEKGLNIDWKDKRKRKASIDTSDVFDLNEIC